MIFFNTLLDKYGQKGRHKRANTILQSIHRDLSGLSRWQARWQMNHAVTEGKRRRTKTQYYAPHYHLHILPLIVYAVVSQVWWMNSSILSYKMKSRLKQKRKSGLQKGCIRQCHLVLDYAYTAGGNCKLTAKTDFQGMLNYTLHTEDDALGL